MYLTKEIKAEIFAKHGGEAANTGKAEGEKHETIDKEEKRKSKDNETVPENIPTGEEEIINDCSGIDFEGIRSLSADGIDISFLENLQTEYEARKEPIPPATVEYRLQQTAELINSLTNCQSSRLAVCPNSNLSQVQDPSDVEMHLAGQVLDNLTAILQHIEPGQVVNVSSIRQAMGVDLSSRTHQHS